MKIECNINQDIEGYDSKALSEMYAMEAYEAIDKIYPKKDAAIIKSNSSLTGNSISVDGFLANALFKGKESYSLVPGLTSSPKAKTSSKGTKYLSVPVEESTFRTVSSTSTGWKHPGFFTEFYKEWQEFISSLQIIDLIFNSK